MLEEGWVQAGGLLDFVDRLSPDWTIAHLWRTLHVDTMNRDELAAMAELPHLLESWRGCAVKRLTTGQVEDWSRRLSGH